MNQRCLALFECASKLIACLLAATVVAAYSIKADQTLPRELRLESCEVQYTSRWAVDDSVTGAPPSAAMSFFVEMAFALARAH